MRNTLPQFIDVIARKAPAALFLFAAVFFMSSAEPALANSKYAGLVIDAKTGQPLYESNADARRYPASLTKMMTLYMLFEALEDGRVKKNTPVTFSRHAAAQPPSKLGIRAGKSIPVETAIYALVTKSANDVAAAVGELLGGSESHFAVLMTRKAKDLGMDSTQFRNASGLPDSRQYTTARDMARLGIALQEHFPGRYKYFSTRSFSYGNRNYRNHNRLLGRVKGVDGIKTGYTNASGFNLVTSVTSGNRRIVAVVLGGKTGRSRNDHMADLIRRYLPKASTQDKKLLVAARRGAAHKVSQFAALPQSDVPAPVERPDIEEIATSAPASDPVAAVVEEQGGVDPITTASNPPSGWVIQVASMPSEADASRFLKNTKSRAGAALASANAFTQMFDQNGTTYYRARFSGFGSKDAAWNACNALKRKKIACYAVMQ